MENLHTRHKLIDALSQAAELEHLLCCSYLYAAFSLKKVPDDTLTPEETETTRKWATTIMLVARQEMEHLGMACNLLSAVGAGANFSRPNFPRTKNYLPIDLPFELRRFGETALKNFIEFEKPDWNEANNDGESSAQSAWPLPYTSLQGLYEYIKEGFRTLNEQLGPENLFIGPTSAQITNENLFQEATKNYSVNLQGIMAKKPQDRLPEAIAIIDQIITEGEGAISNIGTSHYARFLEIEKELQSIKSAKGDRFQPAYPVALNPKTFEHSGDKSGTAIASPLSLEVARLFNLVYEAMMLLLIRFYGHTDESETEITALQEIAFFPLMTMGIRPIAEVLVALPVDDSGNDERAGPTFEIARPFKFLPHKKAAWKVLQELLDETGSEASRIAELAKETNSPLAERLHFIALSLIRNAKNFGAYVEGEENI